MVFVTGGNSQGKLDFVKNTFGLCDNDVLDGAVCDLNGAFEKPVLNHLHLLVGRMTQADVKPEEAVLEGVARNPHIIIICDEVGCGIVPLGAGERAYREEVGRLACGVAKSAEKVYRVFCGISTMIKGE